MRLIEVNLHEEYVSRITVLTRGGDVVIEIQDQHNKQHGVTASPAKAREIIGWIQSAITLAEQNRLHGATGRAQ